MGLDEIEINSSVDDQFLSSLNGKVEYEYEKSSEWITP